MHTTPFLYHIVYVKNISKYDRKVMLLYLDVHDIVVYNYK